MTSEIQKQKQKTDALLEKIQLNILMYKAEIERAKQMMKQSDDTVVNGVKIPAYVELNISHNEHNGVYEKLEDYLDHERFGDGTQEEKWECIKQDSLWEIKFYPITPIGFEFYFSHSLETLLEKIKR